MLPLPLTTTQSTELHLKQVNPTAAVCPLMVLNELQDLEKYMDVITAISVAWPGHLGL